MKRKILLLCLLLSTTIWTFAYDFKSGNLYYTTTSDSTAKVTYEENRYSSGNYAGLTSAVIRESVTYAGTTYRITSIGDEAFSDCHSLTSIIIPNSVTSIGDRAFFGCHSLTSVTIPNSVTSIGDRAFYSSGLTSITIPNSVTTIGGGAFERAPWYENQSDGVIYINHILYAYKGDMPQGTNIVVKEGVTSIGDGVFHGCTGLTSITIGNSVTSIGKSAFYGCRGLTSVTLPNSVTSIGESAFSGCSGLTSVIIPNSVTSIGKSAFKNCRSLTSVAIPNSVTSIGDNAFKDVPNIVYSGVATGAPWGAGSMSSYSYVEGYLFYSDSTKTALQGCSTAATGAISIPNSVTSIGGSAFSSCSGLTSITIPNSVTSIGDCAFNGCSGLTSITIGDSVTSIGKYVFSGCTGLTSITIPNSVTSIGESAFYGCNGLTSITIGDSVTSIGKYVFSGCSGLTSITIPNSVTSIGDYAFNGCTNLTHVEWDAKNCADFTSSNSNTPFNNNAITSFAFGDSVQHIPAYICSGMNNLTSVTIGNSVTNIGGYAFDGCTNLTHVEWDAKNCADFTSSNTPFNSNTITSFVFGDSVQHIPAYICSDMNNLTSVTIGNSVTSIGSSAFLNCDSLTKTNYTGDIAGWYKIEFRTDFYANPVYYSRNFFINDVLVTDLVIPEGTTSIGDALSFDGCLTSVTIPNSVTSIGWYAFLGCSGLTSITIPNSVTSIEMEAFAYCTGLTSVTIPNSVTSIRDHAFSGCSGLTSITIGNSVTTIGDGVFKGCSDLMSVVWNARNYANCSSGYTPFYRTGSSYGDYDLDLRSQITSFVFGDSVQHIPAYICDSMNNLVSITIGNRVTSIGEYAFRDCSGLTKTNYTGDIAGWYNINFGTSANPIEYSRNFFINDTLLTDLVIPEGIDTINDLFRYDTCLISVTIPNGVTSIGEYAFRDCSGLTSVTIGNSVTNIGDHAFSGCSSLTSVVWNAKNYADFTNNATPFYRKGNYYDSNGFDLRSQITSFVFGDSVQHIPAYICNGMNNLTSLTIPNSVENIGSNAFGNCNDLTSVVWKAKKCTGWNNYKYSPFYSEDGNNITSFTFGKEVESIPNYLCYEMKNLTSVVIPNSVDSIGEEAFRNCRALISVAMGKNVTYIGYRAFDGTYWLNNQRDGLIYMKTILYGYKGEMPKGTNIVVREGTTAIGYNALAGYHNLASITFPTSVTNIQDSAFYDCRGLDSITIPDGVAAIGQYAFADCGNLTFAAIGSHVAHIGQGAFGGCNNLTSIVWNAKHCGGWNTKWYAPFNDARGSIMSFTFGDEVDSIPAYLCYGMNRIDSITIPASVTSIGNSAFADCFGLTKTNYTGDVAGWYRIAFDNRQSNPIEYSRNIFLNNVLVTDLVVPANIDTINDAFSRDTRLTSLVIPDGVTAVGNSAFSDCTGLTDISISSTVKSIGERAFINCNRLTSFAIPNSVTTIRNNAFANCTGLHSLIIPNSVTSIGSGAFEDCSSLTTVTIPGSIKSVESRLFSGCTDLRSVIISEGVTSVGDEAFRNCAELTYVTCYATEPPSISSNAFSGVKVDSIPLYVPMESMVKYNSSDVWRDFLVLPISAMPVETDDPVFYPEETKVTIVWPAVEDAIAYTIEISKDSATVCTLLFDAGGVLQNMHYTTLARCAAQHAKQAETIGDGFRFVVEGLDYATTYTYTITATDMDDAVLATYTGTFTTTDPDPATATEDIHSTQSQPAVRKVFRNGQVYILRGDKTYTLTGEEL